MSALPMRRLTEREFLDWESSREDRHEFVDGEIVAMSGGTAQHDIVTVNILTSLATRLRGRPCVVYSSNLKVKSERLGDYFYPDVTVVCGPQRFDSVEPNALVNPTLLIEVLSPTTERYDRGRKLVRYRTIDSLAEHLLVSQNPQQIDRYVRLPDGTWRHTLHEKEGGPVPLESIGVTLTFEEVYARLDSIGAAPQ